MPKKNELDNIELRNEEVQEILTRVPPWIIRWGNLLFFIIIIIFFGITWLIKYPDIITSQAIITTEIPPQKEFAQVTGKIDTILVQDNQFVSSNQPLAIIENTANYEDVFYLKNLINSQKQNLDEFKFPMDNLPPLFLGDIHSEFSKFQNSYLNYSLNKKMQPFESKISADRISISELQKRLIVLNNQEGLDRESLKFKKKDLDRKRTLFEKGVISSKEFENSQWEFIQAERNLKNLSLSKSQIQEELARAKNISNNTDVQKTRESLMLLKNTIQDLKQLKIAIEKWEQEYVLAADISGKVIFMDYWNKNQTINRRDLIFIITPSQNSSYIAKLVIEAKNSGKISVGQEVNLGIANFPQEEFGVLKGKVENISMVPNKDGQYLVKVTLPSELITSYGKKIEFKQEMIGSADIITEDLRLIERIFYQLRNVLVA